MRRSKPFYIFGSLIISIVLMIGAFFGLSAFKKSNAESNLWEAFLQSFDWENFPWDTFPWETFPFDEFENFPWENLPWDDIPEDFPWDKLPLDKIPLEDLPLDKLPEDFDWDSMPWDNMPDNFDWNGMPWENLPEDFDWNKIPWDQLPEDFDWNRIPMDQLPDDFDWNNVPWDSMPEDFDWGKVPGEKLPDDFDWNDMPMEKLPEDFDWNGVPWENLPEDFDWNSVPWENMPEDFDWSRIPWGDLPPDFPWQNIPWEDMPPEFWETFPWNDLPADFPWYVLPWLLISPDLIPEGVLPDDFYPPEWECDHEFISPWVTVQEPTCAEHGIRQNFCIKCKKLISEEIDPTNKHTFEHNICKVCGIRRITIVSDDGSKVYDGKPLTAPHVKVNYDLSALDYGDSVNEAALSFVTFSSRTKVGSSANVFFLSENVPVVLARDNTDATAGYYIERQYGSLQVTPCELKIKTHDLTKKYDGTPLCGTIEECDIEGLAEGDECRLVFGAGVTEIGSKKENIIISYSIFNSKGEDVTDCYTVTTDFGLLSITR